jgi:hypothetical protein
MPRKRRIPVIPGLSFSWKRALGISRVKQKFAWQTGIPTTKSGMQRKLGRGIPELLCPFKRGENFPAEHLYHNNQGSNPTLRKLLSIRVNPTVAGKRPALPVIPLAIPLCCSLHDVHVF